MPDPDHSYPSYRRKGDPSPEDSFIRRATKNPLFDRVIYAVVAAILGGTASVATHKVADANEEAAHQHSREQLLKIEADVEKLRGQLYERVRREEEAREKFQEVVRDRLMVLETKAGMH